MRNWVGPSASLDAFRENSPIPGIEPQSLVCPASNLVAVLTELCQHLDGIDLYRVCLYTQPSFPIIHSSHWSLWSSHNIFYFLAVNMCLTILWCLFPVLAFFCNLWNYIWRHCTVSVSFEASVSYLGIKSLFFHRLNWVSSFFFDLQHQRINIMLEMRLQFHKKWNGWKCNYNAWGHTLSCAFMAWCLSQRRDNWLV